MAIESVWCPVVQEMVTRVTTFDGEVKSVICAEFDPASKNCRLKKTAALGGPLARLLERVSEESLSRPEPRCHVA